MYDLNIYVAITPYSNGYTRYFQVDKVGLRKLITEIEKFTDDIKLAVDVAEWADNAEVGEVFESKYFKAEIIED